jgi:hypothetical protein
MKKTAIVANFTLGLMATPCVLAQSDNEKSKGGDQSSGEHKVVKGVVAGVTILGETMVDYQTNRVITAEKDYLTIVGTPSRGEDSSDQAKKDRQASGTEGKSTGKQDKEVKQTANAGKESRDAGSGSEQSSSGSARVYLVELTPGTEVCERENGGKKKCELAKLDVGDRVEVELKPFNAAGPQSQDTRHGRHRMIRGEALSITILHDKEKS